MRSTVLFAALVCGVFLLNQSQVEAGKGRKRMMALALLSMMNKHHKIIIPFPVPMPIKVYEKKDYSYKESYPVHHYGVESYGDHGGGFENRGGHSEHHMSHGGFGGSGFDGASYSAHPIVNTYDGKIGNEYGMPNGGAGSYDGANEYGNSEMNYGGGY